MYMYNHRLTSSLNNKPISHNYIYLTKLYIINILINYPDSKFQKLSMHLKHKDPKSILQLDQKHIFVIFI